MDNFYSTNVLVQEVPDATRPKEMNMQMQLSYGQRFWCITDFHRLVLLFVEINNELGLCLVWEELITAV